MQHINWGVLGCGHIAQTFVQSMQDVTDASIIACAASHIDRANSFAQSHNIENSYGSYEAMLCDRNIHAIYIATTHNFHFEQIKLCLSHGKHVLCEKPITLNARQAKEVYTLAANHNLLLIEAVWTRFLPATLALQSLLENGTIGKVKSVHANFSLNKKLPDTHRLRNKKLAGGALLDLGIYPITMADIVFAKTPSKISSSAVMTNTGVDENSFYTLEYDCGGVAQLSAGFTMSGPTYALISGDKGSINVPFFLGAKGFELTLEGEQTVFHEYDFAEHQNFTFEIQHMTNCLKTDTCHSNVMPSATSMRVMNIMDTIRGQWSLVYDSEK